MPELPDDHPINERPMPALWNYVKRVYAAMEDAAEVEQLMEDDEATGLVYTGHLTGLFQEMNIPNPYYTSVTRALKAMECVLQLRRGGGSATSRWALLGPPKEEIFLSRDLGTGATVAGHKGKIGMLEQRIRDLTKRMLAAEDEIKELKEAKAA